MLDSIDEAIERTEAVIAATERLRDALLHELLTRGVPGWHTEWKHVPGLGTIPADWQVARLGAGNRGCCKRTVRLEVAKLAFDEPSASAVPSYSQNVARGTLDTSEICKYVVYITPATDDSMTALSGPIAGDVLLNITCASNGNR